MKDEFNDDSLKEKLDEKSFKILRGKETEPPFSSDLLYNKEKGVYGCKACGNELFESTAKFDSGTGWPSFTSAIEGNVELKRDETHGMIRTEVICKRCKSHLGHVFDEPTPTGKRFCINGGALKFKK